MSNTLSKIPVVILCGGMGTRIRAVSEELPKPMVDIGGKPILWHIMKIYSYYGVRKFILALGYKGEKIIEFFENYHSRTHNFTMKINNPLGKIYYKTEEDDSDVDDWEITFVHTGIKTMTGGRIKRVADYIGSDDFFCTYGDGVSNINIEELYKFHKEHNKIATLTGVHLPTTFGVVEFDEDNNVTSFREKPTMEGMINGGFFVFKKEIISYIDDDSTVLEDKPLKTLVKQNQLKIYKHTRFWHCMDHFKDYQELNKMYEENNAPWKLW